MIFFGSQITCHNFLQFLSIVFSELFHSILLSNSYVETTIFCFVFLLDRKISVFAIMSSSNRPFFATQPPRVTLAVFTVSIAV